MEKLELKTLGKFDTIEEMQEALHNVFLQVHNEVYSHFHTKRDEELLDSLLDDLGNADATLNIIIDNDFNVRHLKGK